MTDFEFTVAGDPPGINDSYTIVYQGKRCECCGRGQPRLGKKSHVGTWQDAVAWSVKSARPKGWMPARRTVIEYEVYTTRAGRDSDGPLKALLDGIAYGLGCDDRGFLPRAMRNEKDKANPRVVVRVTNEE